EQIKAFELDDALVRFHDSDDSAVCFVASAMWFHYDDCTDHWVVASKGEWDYFQRVLLLLESNSTATHKRYRQWSVAPVVPARLVGAAIGMAGHFGVGSHLFIFFVPLGLASIVVSRFRQPLVERSPYEEIVSPFSSLGDLRIAYKSAQH